VANSQFWQKMVQQRRLARGSGKIKACCAMRLLFILVAHFLVTLARLAQPGGVRAIAAVLSKIS
jgi:hypothetical protein